MVKEKLVAWLRRHKTKFFDTGIALGIVVLAWAYFNAPININRMTSADWQDTHIQKLGEVTIQKLESNGPYQDIRDIDALSGIGPVKMMQISHYFTTWDTAKADAWYWGLLVGLVLTFSCGFARHVIHTSKKETAKRIERRLGLDDKNVKR